MNPALQHLVDRFKEPSSYAGIATVLVTLGIQADSGLLQAIIYVAAGVCGVAAYLMRDKPKGDQQ